MIFISPKEQLLVEMISERNPSCAPLLLTSLKEVFIHFPERLLSADFDKKLTDEFLRELIKHQEDVGLEKYYSLVTKDDTAHTLGEKCLANGELQDNIFKSLGSFGLTKLIESTLQHMTEAPFADKEVENAKTLIETRNKLRQVEEKFLNDAFKAYLKKQISLYNK